MSNFQRLRTESFVSLKKAMTYDGIDLSLYKLNSTDNQEIDLVPPSKCSPFSLVAVCERISTFKISTWFGKPQQLSPIICARYGWENIGINIIKCSACKNKIQVPESISENDIDKYVGQLDEAHDELCPWKSNPTPESLLNLEISLADFYTNIGEFITEVIHCNARDVHVDDAFLIEFDSSFTLSVTENIMKNLPEKKNVQFTNDQLRKFCGIILSGWKISEKNVADSFSIKCNICSRSIPFSPYLELPNSDKKLHKFFPTKEHRTFCLWSSTNQPKISQFWAEFSSGFSPITNLNIGEKLDKIRKALFTNV